MHNLVLLTYRYLIPRVKYSHLGDGTASTPPWAMALQTSPNFTTWTSRNVRKNQNEWKKHIEYGSRWQVEIFFSAFKRIFGSSVMAKTMDNIIQEIALKIQRYNQFVDITQRVISMA